jgi:hypothetical protein
MINDFIQRPAEEAVAKAELAGEAVLTEAQQ